MADVRVRFASGGELVLSGVERVEGVGEATADPDVPAEVIGATWQRTVGRVCASCRVEFRQPPLPGHDAWWLERGKLYCRTCYELGKHQSVDGAA